MAEVINYNDIIIRSWQNKIQEIFAVQNGCTEGV